MGGCDALCLCPLPAVSKADRRRYCRIWREHTNSLLAHLVTLLGLALQAPMGAFDIFRATRRNPASLSKQAVFSQQHTYTTMFKRAKWLSFHDEQGGQSSDSELDDDESKQLEKLCKCSCTWRLCTASSVCLL